MSLRPCPECGAAMLRERLDGFYCPAAKSHGAAERRRKWAAIFIITIALLILAASSCGCTTTVTAPKITDTQASWDGNEQNSGFLGFDSEGYGILTPHARDRYNSLIAIYGASFTPPLKPDDGLTVVFGYQLVSEKVWRIDRQHLAYFMKLQDMRKENR